MAKELAAEDRPWSPAMMKSWSDHIKQVHRVIARDVTSLNKYMGTLELGRGNPASLMEVMSDMQELLDEVIEQSGYMKSRLYGAMDFVSKHLGEAEA